MTLPLLVSCRCTYFYIRKRQATFLPRNGSSFFLRNERLFWFVRSCVPCGKHKQNQRKKRYEFNWILWRKNCAPNSSCGEMCVAIWSSEHDRISETHKEQRTRTFVAENRRQSIVRMREKKAIMSWPVWTRSISSDVIFYAYLTFSNVKSWLIV